MENDLNNSSKSGFKDESFRLDNMDEYPGEVPGSSQQSAVGSRQSESGSRQAGGSSKGPLVALLLIAGLALIIMLGALIYDWGVNRNGFDDITSLFGFEKKVVIKEKRIIEKDLPEYEQYMDTAGSSTPDEDLVYEEETIEQPEIIEKPQKKAISPDVQKPKEPKPEVPKQTQDTKDDLEKVPYPDNITNRIKKSPVKEADQLFTVQVYSTPSQEDADAWKEKLLKQNISDVIITTQKIKNRDWYRVRFGTFKSADEARRAAIKSGFTHSWIDRIK